MSLLKKDKFSIRKIKGIVGSVFLGSLLFAPSIVGASTYHYLDYSNLTQTERDQLKQGRPDESKESYALVYEKDALPNTGQSQSIMTVFGLLTIGSLVVVITKDKRNKKIATFLIVGATGLVTLSTTSALNLNANIHESGRDGVLQISGYRYVGYLELDERTVSSVSPASTVSPVEQPKVVAEKGEPEVQPELPVAVGSEKVEPAVQPALPEAVVTEKGESEVQAELPAAVVTKKGEPEVQPELPAYVVTEKGKPEVQQDLPEAVVTEKGEPEVQQDLPEAIVTEKGEPAVQQDLPEAVVTEKGEPEVQQVLPEYTTKVAPTLTLDKVTEDAMARSAKLDYTLENTGNAEIKSIIAEIKDGDTVVKRVDLSKEKLTDAIQGLDLFKDYKIATTMTYNRGEGDETSKLDEKPLRLELKLKISHLLI